MDIWILTLFLFVQGQGTAVMYIPFQSQQTCESSYQAVIVEARVKALPCMKMVVTP